MKYNFCMFFNKKYLFQGLALYRSLETNCSDFKIWVLCMDDETYDLLNHLKFEKMNLISASEFVSQELLAVRNETNRNYYWTVKPSFIRFVLQHYPDLNSITYLDSDLFFFSSPGQFLDAFLHDASANVLVVSHQYSENKEYLEKRYGVYNSGVASFKNNTIGLACLDDWSQKCIQYCSARAGEGTFADQHYMSDWQPKFGGVVVFEGHGANLAPWNIKQYEITKRDNIIFVDNDPLIFYHFSSFRIYSSHDFLLFDYSYKLGRRLKHLVYRPYAKVLRHIMEGINRSQPSFIPSFDVKPHFWKFLKFKIKYNVVKFHIRLKESVPLYSRIFYSLFKGSGQRA